LQGFGIVCAMRERTAFPRAVIERLPDLKLLITTGMRNASIDLAAASAHGVTVCGTPAFGSGTAAIAAGLMLDLARRISHENARLKAGAPWQTTIGLDLEGMTLALLGLGKLGARMAEIGRAFKMDIIAWSQNLTAERCKEAGAELVGRDALFRRADFLSVHLQLSERTRGLIGADELALMKPTAFLVNTSRGPITDEAALLAALREKRIAGAGLDVFDIEPLPLDHPFRSLPNVLATPHIGYVSRALYERFYRDTVGNIKQWLDGQRSP